MKTLTLLLLLALTVLNASGQNKGGMVAGNHYVINLDRARKMENMTYSSLFSKVGIIVLEDTDESLLGKIDKIEFLDNNLYVLDRGRGLFMFNKQGKFIKKIGNKGSGPGEYVSLNDMSVDTENKKIYLLDDQTQKILRYSSNGNYEKEFRLENKGTRSSYIQYFNGKLYTNLYTFDKSRNRFLLSEVDINTGKRLSFLLNAAQYNKGWNEMFSTNQHTFTPQPGRNPKFMQIFMDTIFDITAKGVQPYITLQSKNLLTKRDLDKQMENVDVSVPGYISKIYMGLPKTNKIYSPFDYWETDKYIHFLYGMDLHIYTVFYRKDENITYITQGITNDLLYTEKVGTELIAKFLSCDKERLYCVEMNSDFTRNIFLDNIKRGGINPRIEGADKLRTLTDDSNPIIIYYEFKK